MCNFRPAFVARATVHAVHNFKYASTHVVMIQTRELQKDLFFPPEQLKIIHLHDDSSTQLLSLDKCFHHLHHDEDEIEETFFSLNSNHSFQTLADALARYC